VGFFLSSQPQSKAPRLLHAGDTLRAERQLVARSLQPWLQRTRQPDPLPAWQAGASAASAGPGHGGGPGSCAGQDEGGDCALCRLPGPQLEQLLPVVLKHWDGPEGLLAADAGERRLLRALRQLPQQQRLELAWEHLEVVLRQLPRPGLAVKAGQEDSLQLEDLQHLVRRWAPGAAGCSQAVRAVWMAKRHLPAKCLHSATGPATASCHLPTQRPGPCAAWCSICSVGLTRSSCILSRARAPCSPSGG
jgi:hypothetical protein